MANEWLRLWHDMPNDPKFRTVARISKQPISLVLGMYLHLLVDASRNVTRGHVDVTFEDLASALDVTEDQISQIYEAMEGRLKQGNRLTGWESRQPKKEDHGNTSPMAMTPAERKRAQREREMSRNVTQSHEGSHDVTLDKDKDKDKDKEINTKTLPQAAIAKRPKFDFFNSLLDLGADVKSVEAWMQVRKEKKATNTEIALKAFQREAVKAGLSIADAVLICAERSWSGLNADWIKPNLQASPVRGSSKLGAHGQATANAAQKWLEGKNAR